MAFLQLHRLFLCWMLFLYLLHLGQAVDTTSAKLSELLTNKIKRGYDKRVRPSAAATNVSFQIAVIDLGPINQKTLSLRSDIILRQWWNDPRLAFDNTSVLNYNGDPTSDIWVPDTYVSNARESQGSGALTKNIRTKIGPNGDVYVSTRLTLVFACNMDFHMYPFDTQTCSMDLESYAYTMNEVRIMWKPAKPGKPGTKPINFVLGNLKISEYELKDVEATSLRLNYLDTQPFSLLKAVFRFERLFAFYLYHIYIPGALLVALSWCTFWIPPAAVPARVTLVVTNFLSSVFVFDSAGTAIPKVSYQTPLELFILVNIAFIILAMVEYIFVLKFPDLIRRQKKCNFLNRLRRRKSASIELGNDKNMNPAMEHIKDECEEHETNQTLKSVHLLDLCARVVVPLTYIVFVILYFIFFTTQSHG